MEQIKPEGGERPQNYQGTVDSMRLLKSSPSVAYAQSLELVKKLLKEENAPSEESGYSAWSKDDLRQLLQDLGESE